MLLNINWEFLDLTLKHQVVEALEVKMKGRCEGRAGVSAVTHFSICGGQGSCSLPDLARVVSGSVRNILEIQPRSSWANLSCNIPTASE